MTFTIRGLLLAAGAAVATSIAPVQHAAAKPSIADFVRHPTYGTVKISPTGEYLAMTADKGEQTVLVVLRTADLKPLKINQLPDEKSVGSFYWTSPERLIFTAIRKVGRFAQPFGTGETFSARDVWGALSYARRFTDQFSAGITLRFADESIGALGLLLGALLPTAIAAAAFLLL